MSFADWSLRVIALELGFEADIRRARHKQYTHTHKYTQIHTHTHTHTHTDTHTHTLTHTHRHRIFLEIVKHRINYFWYKLFKLLTFRKLVKVV